VGQILNPQTAVERAQRGTLGRVQLPFAGWQMLVYGGADHYLREGVEVVGLQFRTR
jgi:hypothetical protein